MGLEASRSSASRLNRLYIPGFLHERIVLGLMHGRRARTANTGAAASVGQWELHRMLGDWPLLGVKVPPRPSSWSEAGGSGMGQTTILESGENTADGGEQGERTTQ